MATSPHKGYLRTGRLWTGNTPVDASFARDVVLNNLCHAADEFAQVRVNFARTNFNLADDAILRYGADNTIDEQWRYVGSLGRWPVPLRADGRSYRYRIRIAGASMDGSSTNQYRVILAPPDLAARYLNATEDFVFHAEAVSNSSAHWLTGTSMGPNVWADMMEIPAREAAIWTRVSRTLTTISGEDTGAVHPIVSANIYGRTLYDDPDPDWFVSVEALHITEWIGT